MKNKLILLFFLPLFGYAQTVFQNNGSAIYIQQNGLIHVQGDFVNANADSGASIKNDGTIEIKGDFENRTGAKFGVSVNDTSKERVVKFIGSGSQLIKGDMARPDASFYNLVIDMVDPADTVEARTSMIVEGSLVFGTANTTYTYNPTATYTNHNQKGLLKSFVNKGIGRTEEYVVEIKNGNPDAISGYPVLETNGLPTTGYILTSGARGSNDGGLKRNITSATTYAFPVGTPDKGFNGVKLNFSAIPGDGNIKMKFCSGSSNPTGRIGKIDDNCSGCGGKGYKGDGRASNNLSSGTGNGNAPLAGFNKYVPTNDCNGIGQWVNFDKTIENHGYWSFESSNRGYTYDIEVFPTVETMNMGSMWRVLKHEAAYDADPSTDEVDWSSDIDTLITDPKDLITYTKNAGCYSGSGIPGGNYKNFSHFTLGEGGSGGGGALPVTLLYVKAEAMGKHRVKVSWATAIEISNKGFHVLRSTDAINFTEVGWVDGHNNSTVTLTYSFDDRVPQNGTYYYKLKQEDFDGHTEFSPVVEAKFADEVESEFKLYPNPTANDVMLEVQNPLDEIKVAIYDVTGQLVYDNIYVVEQNGVTKTLVVNAADYLPKGTYIMTATTNGAKYSSKFVLQ